MPCCMEDNCTRVCKVQRAKEYGNNARCNNSYETSWYPIEEQGHQGLSNVAIWKESGVKIKFFLSMEARVFPLLEEHKFSHSFVFVCYWTVKYEHAHNFIWLIEHCEALNTVRQFAVHQSKKIEKHHYDTSSACSTTWYGSDVSWHAGKSHWQRRHPYVGRPWCEGGAKWGSMT